MPKRYLETPLGSVEITGDSDGITSVKIVESYDNTINDSCDLLEDCARQLTEYFQGDRKEFNLKLNPAGTQFQQKTWNALMSIPYGRTVSYLELARRLRDKKAVRAVAAANGKNPIWIIIPCHRVVGSDGSLVGYAGGIQRKKYLLNHECRAVQTKLF